MTKVNSADAALKDLGRLSRRLLDLDLDLDGQFCDFAGLAAVSLSSKPKANEECWQLQTLVSHPEASVPAILEDLPHLFVGTIQDLGGTGAGASIGLRQGVGGTLGGHTMLENAVFGLTAGHVLSQRGQPAPIGEPVWRPAPRSYPHLPKSQYGTVSWISPLKKRGNRVDLGVVACDESSLEPMPEVETLVPETGDTLAQAIVHHDGCVTGNGVGTVTRVGVEIKMDTMGRLRRFDGLFAIESRDNRPHFAQPGDSGSLIRTQNGNAVGMVIGGSDYGSSTGGPLAWATPSSAILNALSEKRR